MASLLNRIILLVALVLLAFGGYLFFVSSQAPNFTIFGDITTTTKDI